jgi:hypothetical protein
LRFFGEDVEAYMDPEKGIGGEGCCAYQANGVFGGGGRSVGMMISIFFFNI